MGRPREFDETAAVDAAIEVFWTKGYAATSTEDLCARTGLGRGSLYNTFRSKHALYEKALRRYGERGAEDYREILERPGPVRERIRALLMGAVDPASMGRGCLIVNAAIEAGGSDEDIARIVRRQSASLEQVLSDALSAARRDGEIAPDRDPLSTARSLVSAFWGLRVLARAAHGPDVLIDVVDGTLAGI